MKKGTFKPKTTVHVQYLAHQEVECIVSQGKVYLEFPTPDFAFAEVAEEEPKVTSPKKSVDATPAAEKPKSVKKYSEDEMMEMETSELEKICKSLGIDYNKKDGKNTNKKLRLLILDAQDGAEEELERAEETPKSKSKEKAGTAKASKGLKGELEAILGELDNSDIDETEAVKQILALDDNFTKKAVNKIIEEMMADADQTIDEVAEKLLALVDEEEAEEKPKGRGAAKSKETVVEDWDTLEVGDKVNAHWEGDGWFTGEVVKVDRKGIHVKYDTDGVVSVLDDTEVIEVKLIA